MRNQTGTFCITTTLRYFLFPILLASLRSALALSATDLASYDPSLQVEIRRTERPPDIDGHLHEAVWETAIPCRAFFQREPVEGTPASEITEVRLLFDDDKIYVGTRCLDSQPQRIVADRMRRDVELDKNDSIQLIFDTYNDGRSGFFFSTNALGTQWDMLLTDEGRSRNAAWHCVWESRATLNDSGWTAEIAIPFDQLRYAASDSAVWGININRIIPRKNEEDFLMPPPQSYGFHGRFRTSKLAQLLGLGSLRPIPRLEVVPYLQTGSLRDNEAIDHSRTEDFNSGLDLKYGLSPGMTLDLSYRTDFAQVEADQEQVNLTRFNLFLPERRGFFLEGAGIFEFGERRRRFGGAPPTLIFYSRRIGLQDGHTLPVIAGGKVTGRVGSYQIGVLNFATDRDTYLEEINEEILQSAAGDSLSIGDPTPHEFVTVDTMTFSRIDTISVPRTNFSVLRLRKDVLGRSNVGLIAFNRDPGQGTDYNRGLGLDFNLSLLEAALNLRGFAAQTYSPLSNSENIAGELALEYRAGAMETTCSYLEIGDQFEPEIGFVPRVDIRRYSGRARYRPLSNRPWIRRYSVSVEQSYLTDRSNQMKTRDLTASAYANLEAGDWLGLRLRHRFERLEDIFEIHDDINIPAGKYNFTNVGLNLFSNNSRRLTTRTSIEMGTFFGGRRNRFSANLGFKFNHRLNTEISYELNRIDLTAGNFRTQVVNQRMIYSFNPDLFVRAFGQWNSKRELAGWNLLINYRYQPGSDLYLVYNQAWDTVNTWQDRRRSIQLKTTYFLSR